MGIIWICAHNYLYNISEGTGCDTGLITIEAYESKNFTDEHVYSNVKTSHKILELYKKGILDLDWLMDNVQHIVPTIKTTPEQNMLLRKSIVVVIRMTRTVERLLQNQ